MLCIRKKMCAPPLEVYGLIFKLSSVEKANEIRSWYWEERWGQKAILVTFPGAVTCTSVLGWMWSQSQAGWDMSLKTDFIQCLRMWLHLSVIVQHKSWIECDTTVLAAHQTPRCHSLNLMKNNSKLMKNCNNNEYVATVSTAKMLCLISAKQLNPHM